MKSSVAKCHSISSARYLGVKITDGLKWGQHINEITSQTTKTLCFLRRNLTFTSKETKAAAYKAKLVHHNEYAAPVWMLCHQVYINRIEKVQRTAASSTCKCWCNQNHIGKTPVARSAEKKTTGFSVCILQQSC